MRHEERMQLAQDLCARMVATHPGDVILGGVYGSTARGTDTRWSDLEMLFVVRDGSQVAGKSFIYQGYQILVPALWSARDTDEIVPLAERLVRSFWQLLADEGIHVENYQAVDDLPV